MRHPRAAFVVLVVVALCWDSPAQRGGAAEDKPAADPKAKAAARTDLYGDPLPPGAVARMGTLRWSLPFGGRLEFTPDGKALAARLDDGSLHFWDMSDGRENRVLKVDGLTLTTRFSPDGKVVLAWVAAAESNDTVVLLDAASGHEIRRMTEPDGNVTSLAFSPDGSLLAVGYEENRVCLWEVDSGKNRLKLEGLEFPIRSVHFSPDGRSLLVQEVEHVEYTPGKKTQNQIVLRMYDLPAGRARWSITGERASEMVEIQMLPDGDVVTCRYDKIHVLAAEDGKDKRVIPLEYGSPKGPWVVSKDGKALIGWSGRRDDDSPYQWHWTIALLSLADDAPPQRLEGEKDEQGGYPLLSPDGKLVVTSDRATGVAFWDLAAKRRINLRPGPEGGVGPVFFAPDRKTLISGCGDGTIRFWDAATGKELRKFSGKRGLRPLALSPDGAALATTADDGFVHLLNAATGEELRPLEGQDPRNGNAVRNVAFSPDGKVLAGGGAKNLILWDTASGKQSPPVEGPARLVLNLAFSPDGATVAGVGYSGRDRFDPLNNMFRMWDAKSGKLIRQLALGTALWTPVFAPDNRSFAAIFGEGGEIGLWDSVTGRVIRRADLKGVAHPYNGQPTITFWPDGKTFMLATQDWPRDFSLYEYETATCQVLSYKHFTGHAGLVGAIVLAPDGRRVVSASADGTALVWDLQEAAPQFFPEPPRTINAAVLDCFWDDLNGDDAATAYRAVCSLAAYPQETIDFLKGRLAKAPPRDAEAVRRLIAELNSDDFERREAASRKLKELGQFAEPELRQAAASSSPTETQQRAVALLGAIDYYALSPGRLREIRAVQVLERIGSAETRRLLEDLAEGEPLAPLTRDARAAAERLGARQNHP